MPSGTIGGWDAGQLVSSSVTAWTYARDGSDSVALAGGSPAYIGSRKSGSVWYSYEVFQQLWVTAFLFPEDAALQGNGAVIELFVSEDHSATNFDVRAYLVSWASPIDIGDYIDPATLSSSNLLATLSTSGMSTGSWLPMTMTDIGKRLMQDGFFEGTVNFDIVLVSSRAVNNNAPTGDEYIGILGARVAYDYEDHQVAAAAGAFNF
jgi:hypothetical protein